jgi:hypothetical protein
MLKGIASVLLDSMTHLFFPLFNNFYNTTYQGFNVAKKTNQETQQKVKPIEAQVS